jgi:tetratricopeptide (TPR) repeat protein
MGALPMPEIPPGPQRDLLHALHELHHRAGWPSLRTLARAAGCSPTTVSAAFSSPRLPSWGILELLVEDMGGDVPDFHRLWLAASTPAGTRQGAVAPRIAGRRAELAAVHRHLESGAGLLLVSGEAGIGKTRLVTTAADATDTVVATGSCLPLSVEVPLLPVADLLRSVYAVDAGQWFNEALAECPDYVAISLRRLLPELDPVVEASTEPEDEWSRQRLFSAVGAILTALGAPRSLAVVIEDLHWADTATLDLFEHLLARGPTIALVGTWRSEDPATPRGTTEWLTRVRRLPTVVELNLSPLTSDETNEQLVMLGAPVTADDVDRIFRRSRGLPLFTEQLAAQAKDTGALPELLADLLDRRLDNLDLPARAIARTLGAADRALPEPILRAATALPADELHTGLHGLDQRRLLAVTERDVALRHPLLAEAARRRLLPGEAAETHRQLALALAEVPDADPAEIAGHWQAVDDPIQELTWRIRAARAAADRFAFAQAATHWQRAVELWPDDCPQVDDLSRVDAGLAGLDALIYAGEIERSPTLVASLAEGLISENDAGQLLLRRSLICSMLGDTAEALRMASEAVAIFETGGPSGPLALALKRVSDSDRNLGRLTEARAAVSRALEICEAIGDTTEERRILVLDAWDRAVLRDLDGALAALDRARRLPIPEPDPITDIQLAAVQTDLQLRQGAPTDEIEKASRSGLLAADRWNLDNYESALLRANVAAGLFRAGHVDRAVALVDPVTDGDPVLRRWVTHQMRIQLDVARGRLDEALTRVVQLDSIAVTPLSNKLEFDAAMATAELWAGRPEAALTRLLGVLDEATGTDVAHDAGECLALATRAAADLAAAEPGRRRPLLERLRTMWTQIGVEPGKGPASGPASVATGEAELGRLGDNQSVEIWTGAAMLWDKLARPYDAAYCRWRAAQVALATGQATLAQRLLKRAATDAREHAPLRAAIRHAADGQ